MIHAVWLQIHLFCNSDLTTCVHGGTSMNVQGSVGVSLTEFHQGPPKLALGGSEGLSKMRDKADNVKLRLFCGQFQIFL